MLYKHKHYKRISWGKEFSVPSVPRYPVPLPRSHKSFQFLPCVSTQEGFPRLRAYAHASSPPLLSLPNDSTRRSVLHSASATRLGHHSRSVLGELPLSFPRLHEFCASDVPATFLTGILQWMLRSVPIICCQHKVAVPVLMPMSSANMSWAE